MEERRTGRRDIRSAAGYEKLTNVMLVMDNII